MENVPTTDQTYPKIGNYEFLSVLGRGGMGVVCKYRSATLNKFAAVKMITEKELSEVAMVRFQREGQAAARLQHPGIVGIHDLGVTEHGDPYMIMDYFEGETVEELLNRKYQFSIKQLETIFLQCAEAMQHAHSQGVLHRDLKPSNIMVTNLKTDQIVIKILDFGIAKILDESGEFTTTTGMNAGSPLYMSPEQSLGSPIDARADIYSLGCVFYAILVGEPPFKGKNSLDLALQHQKEKPLPISQIPHLKNLAYMGNTIMAMLEKDPLKRPQSMRQVCSMLSKGSGTSKKRDNTLHISKGRALAVVAGIAVSVFVGTRFLFHQNDEIEGAAKARSSALNLADQPVVMSAKDRTQLEFFRNAQTGNETMDFNGRTLSDKTILSLQADRRVQQLGLAGSGISDTSLTTIGDLPLLKDLNLSNNLNITDTGIKSLANLHGLRALDISVTKITDTGMETLGKLVGLENLDLEQTGITDKGIKQLQNLKNLRRLSLSNTGIGDDSLRFLSSWPKLTALSLQRDKISDKGIAYIKYLPQLEDLAIHGTNISKKSVALVARLKNLKVLDVPDGFDDESMRIISQMPNLEILKLSDKNTEQSLKYLMHMRRLRKLIVRGQIPNKGAVMVEFQTDHPDCKIDYEAQVDGSAMSMRAKGFLEQ